MAQVRLVPPSSGLRVIEDVVNPLPLLVGGLQAGLGWRADVPSLDDTVLRLEPGHIPKGPHANHAGIASIGPGMNMAGRDMIPMFS